MNIKDELLFDFSITLPRILVSGKTGIIDNVKKIEMFNGNSVIADTGAVYTIVHGQNLLIRKLEEERLIITGTIEKLEFYDRSSKEKGASE